MNEHIEKTYDDKRKIGKLYISEGQGGYWVHGDIKPYLENGEMAHVVWFAVIEDGIITRRINGKYVCEVVYESKEVQDERKDSTVVDDDLPF